MLLALALACSTEPAAPPAEATPSSWPIARAAVSPRSVAWLTEQGWWPLQVGYFADVPGFSAHWAVMREDKLLEKRGVTVMYTTFLSGPPILEAFLAGQTQVTHYGDFPFWNTVDKGVGAVAFAVTGVNNEVALIVPPDSPARTIDDLKGREVVIGTTLGSYAEFFLLSVPGLRYRVAGMSMREAQLVPKGVDAVAVWDPHATFAVEKGLGRKVGDHAPYYFATGYEFVRREIHEHAPDVVQAIADATLEAVLAVRADPDRAAAIYASDPRGKAWTKEQVRAQIDRYLTVYPPTYKYLHADFWAAEDARVVAAQHAAGRLTRARDAEDLKKDFAPGYLADTLKRLGWAVPERPVFLPAGWSGTVGQPPYPPYVHAGDPPIPWP
ncbi:MAG: ABC transporter substrate-binding protein [Myxococcota bacterium]